jgi:hypothetical protein
MAICKYCEQEMHTANGCVKLPIKTIDGEMDPILYGSETRNPPEPAGHWCHDCDALPGHYHHVGCDWEECPRCHGQLLSCDCEPVEPATTDGSEEQAGEEEQEGSN